MSSLKETRDIMGMPIAVEIVGDGSQEVLEMIFAHFAHIDEVFSPYKPESAVSRINRGELTLAAASDEVQYIYNAAEKTRKETGGAFNHRHKDGTIDPSGIVKGWAIQQAAKLLRARNSINFCIDAGGDIQTSGSNSDDTPWSVGIRHPFETNKIAKIVYPKGRGVATSGTYLRGRHIYDPSTGMAVDTPYVSLSVIGPDVYDADRFATAAFAMGERGLHFIENLFGYEAYAITHTSQAFFTSGFDEYTKP